MEFLNTLPYYQEAFLRLFYPSGCALCQRLLELEERGLCLVCLSEVRRLKLLPSEERVRISLTYGKEAWSLFRYEGAVKEVFHKFKFEKRRDLLSVFSQDLALFFGRRPRLADYDFLIPIPLDWRRRIEREFNQSSLLGRMICRNLKSRICFEKKALLKNRSTPPQSLLGREGRKINLGGVFRIPKPHRLQGRSVLLIDDIFTTGATLEEAAKTLKSAGASRIGYFSLARTFQN